MRETSLARYYLDKYKLIKYCMVNFRKYEYKRKLRNTRDCSVYRGSLSIEM